MDCNAYCTASSYQIKNLFEFLREHYKTVLYRDVIHVEVPHEDDLGDLFLFPYGSAVFWGVDKEKIPHLLISLRPYEVEHKDEVDTDEFTFVYGEAPKVADDEITLPNRETLTKLAISHGIAQSVKLSTFETAILKAFNTNQEIPQDLAKKGKISLSRNEIRKKMGELFNERTSINLHLDALDLPEFFWEYPELESLYRMITNYLDVQPRVEVLNKRLGIVHELFEVLGNELNHQHTSRLELTIILLIVIEVALTLLRDVFKVF
jgi:uncharacterized Rmd1/YagE family protein